MCARSLWQRDAVHTPLPALMHARVELHPATTHEKSWDSGLTFLILSLWNPTSFLGFFDFILGIFTSLSSVKSLGLCHKRKTL